MKKNVKVRFRCVSIEQFDGGIKTVKLKAASSIRGKNSDFTEGTNTGFIEIDVSPGMPAAHFFSPGKYYNIDFSRDD